MAKSGRICAICGTLVLLLLCRPLIALPLGRTRKVRGCSKGNATAFFPVKDTVPFSKEKSRPPELAPCPSSACRACLPSIAKGLAGGAAGPEPSAPPRVRRRSDRGLKVGWDGSHFYIRRARRFEVDPNGYFQFTYRGHAGPAAPNNDFVLRRAVLGVRGTLGRRYDFDISAEISDRKTPLRSADLQFNYNPALQLKLGRFREPFSREALVSSRYREFAERAMINNLVPGDGFGVMAQGVILKHTVQYQAGFFGSKGVLAETDSITPDGVVRLRFTPWARNQHRYLAGMTFGSAFADGKMKHGESFKGSTASGSFVFFGHEPVNGKVIRANGEWTWLIGPAGFHAEYIQTQQERQGLGPEGVDLPGVIAKGYYLSATDLITGEDRVEDAQPVPHFPVFGRGRKGVGAWEVKFRYSTLHMTDGTRSNQVDTFTPGLNWYLTRFVRIMIDLNVEQLKKPVVLPLPRQPGPLLSASFTAQFRF